MMAAMLLAIGVEFVTLLKRIMSLNRNGVVQAKCQIIKVEL